MTNHLDRSSEDKVFSIQLKGALDGVSAEDLFRYLESQIESGFTRFLFNFGHVEFITSNGISTLIKIRKKMIGNPGLSYVFYALGGEAESVLQLLGLYKKLPIKKNLNEAEEYLRSQQTQGKSDLRAASVLEEERSRIASQDSKERIRFYYTGSPKSARGEEVVSKLESYAPPKVSDSAMEKKPVSEKQTVGGHSVHETAKPSEMETILEEKITSLRKEIKETLSFELEKRLSFVTGKETSSEVSGPIKIPNYIQPKSKQVSLGFEKIFPCEACGTKLRATKVGRHQCPTCRTEVYVNNTGSVRFLEKLNT
ncbi:STAS domain-containing protein [Leptospira ilyithenensis]|uniref:Anti-sigma factor antagonist n=1 Tax=Leptospira ilyithenensis TaxID=2484901 RepID=A0A4R9LUF8_9LEPT|nr:STAS domain-containing protein [Leptospira ilyithenensis]TGN14076.1 anti-sigma factor antagonist [Leptospira ilyithenensis]